MKLAAKLLQEPTIYFRTHKLGELYFRFIKGTALAKNGWTGELLAQKLVAWGFIQMTSIQIQDALGHFQKPEKVYFNLPGKRISRKELVNLVLTQSPYPPGLLQRAFKKESV